MSSAIVVGAGPVGLFLALELAARDIEPTVFERRATLRHGSRCIGVHAPSLELLDALQLGDAFVRQGVRITTGHVFGPRTHLGSVSFAHGKGAHRYVLSIPQERSEALLLDALVTRAPGCLRTDTDVQQLVRMGRRPRLRYRAAGTDSEASADLAFACEGKRSQLLKQLNIRVTGRTYPGSYLMADCADTTEFGDAAAAVFLAPDGPVESFPLPDRRRRWVARFAHPCASGASTARLAEAVWTRTGHLLDEHTLSEVSPFRAECQLASHFSAGRIAIVGDAAHIVSPIGGQGMNLGLLGAHDLAVTAQKELQGGGRGLEGGLRRAGRLQRRRARAAIHRAELNMWLGGSRPSLLHRGIVSCLLRAPTSRLLARLFSMRGLSWGI